MHYPTTKIAVGHENNLRGMVWGERRAGTLCIEGISTHALRYNLPPTRRIVDVEPVLLPLVAWQVYFPSWDWYSSLMVRL